LSISRYTYEAAWSEEERTFIARVREFPSLEARASSRGAALRSLKSVVYTVAKEMSESGAGSQEQRGDGERRGSDR
jgi:hypothetical protein